MNPSRCRLGLVGSFNFEPFFQTQEGLFDKIERGDGDGQDQAKAQRLDQREGYVKLHQLLAGEGSEDGKIPEVESVGDATDLDQKREFQNGDEEFPDYSTVLI